MDIGEGGKMVIGIDPGFSGALAIYSARDHRIVDLIDMPLEPLSQLAPNSPKTIDGRAVVKFIRKYEPHVTLAVLERVHAMPEQGVSSMFRFGEGFGMIQGIVYSTNIRLLMPPAAVWKSVIGVSAAKCSSLELVRKEFPGSDLFGRKKDDGRAEALLLAMFGARSLGLKVHGGDGINAIL